MRWFVLLFIIIPLSEMMLLFEVAERIGGLSTLGLVVLTAVIGVQILRWQGVATLFRANQRLQSGQLPAQEILEGMLLAAAGALLLTPGFITDTLGFLLLTSPLRRAFAAYLIRSGVTRSLGGGGAAGFYYQGRSHEAPDIFEGDFTEEDPDDERDPPDRLP